MKVCILVPPLVVFSGTNTLGDLVRKKGFEKGGHESTLVSLGPADGLTADSLPVLYLEYSRAIVKCDVLVALCHEQSIAMGMFIGRALEACKPVIVLVPADREDSFADREIGLIIQTKANIRRRTFTWRGDGISSIAREVKAALASLESEGASV